MDGARTIGQPAALQAIRGMIAGRTPHAVLLAGPVGVGKTTLALDLAAGLLCTTDPIGVRPCRACRACRLVDSGNHPDLHRLAPAGAGGQIRIGERMNPDPGTVRALISALALLPVEGGYRVAMVEAAERLNEDAQSALLKTLEEPPSGAVLILCVDDEERLLPTVRSRCARVRLGPLGVRDLERMLTERGAADAPTAARLARISGGRPGVALMYALSPDATVIRAELGRSLLDLMHVGTAARLTGVRDLLARAADLHRELAAGLEPPSASGSRAPMRDRSNARSERGAGPVAASDGDSGIDRNPDGDAEPRSTAADRRRAAHQLLEIWRDLVRDLALAGLGEARGLHDPELVDDPVATETRLPLPVATAFLERLVRAGDLLESNVGPELILDTVAVHWRIRSAA